MWLRRVTGVAVVVTAVLTLAMYPSMPTTVPTHFNGLGQADDWGPKYSLLIMAGVLLLLVGALDWLSRRPRLFNYPREVTEANAQSLYRIGEQMMVWTNLGCTGIFASLVLSVVAGVNATLLIVPWLAVLLGAVAVGIARMIKVGG
ncbi:DUF1648 domain-containing protein [Corynebacterium sp. AOP12-C2-36]|uniref:DUF1648 domain-containing protein n=1 Tax=Corynebacterium sp. AOP12-C2-36 TaxID=3457723 RepID=UPI0040343AD6